MGAIVPFTDRQIALIRKTVAKDCDTAELDWFISICRALKLDPLRRQIYAFVFSKDDPTKRAMIPVVAIGGYRSIAERTGNYRPGKTVTVLDDACIDPDTNPKGISHAEATVWKYVHGDWHEITETAYWDEFAPIVTEGEGGFEWKETGDVYPDGHAKAGKKRYRKVPIGDTKQKLDPRKDGWHRMPRVMIEKCAEAKALRRAWPDDFAGTYVEGEIDRADVLELTPSEMADAADRTDRIAKLGGPNAIMVQWEPAGPIERVPTGQFGDRAIQFVKAAIHDEMPTAVAEWKGRNAQSLNDYWAQDKDGFLMLKREIEKADAMIVQAMAAE